MNRIEFTAADRGPDGRLLAESPMERIRRLQAELEAPNIPEPAPDPPAEIRPQLPVATYGQLFGALAIIAAMAALAAYALWPKATTDHRPPAAAPVMAPAASSARPTATLAPTAEPSPTAPPTATAEPPTATPVVIVIEVAPACDPAINPLYSVQLDVYSADRKPLGQVVGVSCDSQADAQANADALAAELREGK